MSNNKEQLNKCDYCKQEFSDDELYQNSVSNELFCDECMEEYLDECMEEYLDGLFVPYNEVSGEKCKVCGEDNSDGDTDICDNCQEE